MHFTYIPPDKAVLCQGDLIKYTPNLEELLQEYHPYYHREKYLYFTVLTQSCDLIKRDNGECRSKYINLAVLWPFKKTIQREINKLQYDPIEKKLGFINEKLKSKLVQFVERIFNNNEVEYFFFYREPHYQLEQDYCAFLQQTISLDSKKSYDILLDAKFLQLKEAFQSKLGHAIGEMFSRVGTEDWLPKQCTPDRFKKYIHEPIEDASLVLWIEDLIHRKVLKEMKRLEASHQTIDRLEEEIKKIKITKAQRIEEVLQIIATELGSLNINEVLIGKAIRRFRNNPKLPQYIK